MRNVKPACGGVLILVRMLIHCLCRIRIIIINVQANDIMSVEELTLEMVDIDFTSETDRLILVDVTSCYGDSMM